jgi:hypothetical protein
MSDILDDVTKNKLMALGRVSQALKAYPDSEIETLLEIVFILIRERIGAQQA